MALNRTLDVLLGLQCSEPWEIVLVDNGSTDGTDATFQRFAARSHVPVVLVFEGRRGLGRARNAGVARANGEFLFFTDDDCYPAADAFDAALQFMASHPRVGLVGGQVILHDPADARISIRGGEPLLAETGQFVEAGFLIGANMMARRSALEAVGGFDDELGAGTKWPCEDIDLATRMLFSGIHVAFEPSVIVRHHHGRRHPDELTQLRKQYGYARGAHYAKNLLRRESFGPCARHLARSARDPHYLADWQTRLAEARGAFTYVASRLGKRLG